MEVTDTTTLSYPIAVCFLCAPQVLQRIGFDVTEMIGFLRIEDGFFVAVNLG